MYDKDHFGRIIPKCPICGYRMSEVNAPVYPQKAAFPQYECLGNSQIMTGHHVQTTIITDGLLASERSS